MTRPFNLKFALMGAAAIVALADPVFAADFDIPGGDLKAALDTYAHQTGVALVYREDAVKGVRTKGARGDLTSGGALSSILAGTGFTTQHQGGALIVVRDAQRSEAVEIPSLQVAQADLANRAAVETVTVTSSKLGGVDMQSIPISITALSQEQLTATQTAGGPDLVKQVPNMSFTKTNFSGYSIQLRGIGTQAISVTTDPAVAVAFNDIPFIRNHFFEQEFYDVSSVEVLRGPQGTLYGRNATAGVVNLESAKPTDQFEAMASIEIGNYGERRPEGMINIPIDDDVLDIRVAGEWTKRQGYSFNELTDSRADNRDLWSGRVTIGWKPVQSLQAYLVWEHFSEDDGRIRSAKQLCKTDPIPTTIDGVTVPGGGAGGGISGGGAASDQGGYFSQGCLPASLYSPESFEVPNGFALPYIAAGEFVGGINGAIDPYAETTQSHNLRVFQSALNPTYRAKNDVVELNADYSVTPALTFTSQTGFGHDFLYSTQDYNRFNTAPGLFIPGGGQTNGPADTVSADGVFCDPQLGCSDRIVAQDLSDEHAWQLSQEFRLTSNFSGPLNFSVGANYLHYETEENYYVFINANTLTAIEGTGGNGGAISTGSLPYDYVCAGHGSFGGSGGLFQYHDPAHSGGIPTDADCIYTDPNPLGQINNAGHNYFLSQNPYTLNSYAGFGEANYNVLPDLKLIVGLRWTEDQKHFTEIPSQVLSGGYGYLPTGVVNQQWDQFTGRTVANWTPKFDFTDQTLVYGSYSHGYKAGGANPPGPVLIAFEPGDILQGTPVHPLTFKPEFVDAFEFGSKNTLLDGALTLNADVFYYNYENYQISEIVDRTSINLNFDAHIKGAEIESSWEPIPGLRFNFAGGWESTSLAKGDSSVDLIDRTDAANHPGWMVIKPFIGQASNCILPAYVVVASLLYGSANSSDASTGAIIQDCGAAYNLHVDPVTDLPYVTDPTVECVSIDRGISTCASTAPIPVIPGRAYVGFDPTTAPNDGQGFSKNLAGNRLPNAPPLTVSFGTQYTIPLTMDWAGTLRGDYYWQDYSWARVFNDNPYDRLRGYTNVNLTLIFTNQNGWQVMLYDKNVFNTTAITGDFLNSDDSGLTTNIFLTDPKLIGIRVTKNW